MGQRLRQLRTHLNYSPREMAARLGIQTSPYYKNENGDTLPGSDSLYRLHQDFGISLDWLFFNYGPMYYRERQSAEETEKPEPVTGAPPTWEERMPGVQEMLQHMEQDPLLRHRILLYYYSQRDNEQPAPPPDPQ